LLIKKHPRRHFQNLESIGMKQVEEASEPGADESAHLTAAETVTVLKMFMHPSATA